MFSSNGCRIHVDNITGEKLSSNYKVAISTRIYKSGSLSSRRKEDGVNGGHGGYVILARYRVHFIKKHKNLV